MSDDMTRATKKIRDESAEGSWRLLLALWNEHPRIMRTLGAKTINRRIE